MMETNPQGWKARQEMARRKSRNRSPEERAKVRAIRAAHKASVEAEIANTTIPAPEPFNPATAPAEPQETRPVESMDWDELAGEMRKAGKFVPPRIKIENLREKVRDLRDGEEAVSGIDQS